MTRVAVLISGRGSNLRALAAASAGASYRLCGVVSNRPGAAGLEIAARAGIATRVVDHAACEGRQAFEAALAAALEPWEPDLLVLAGFMRVLSEDFVARRAGRMLNIHPSLLPRHPGLHTHRRVLEAGDEEHGASVHFVTADLDRGPVLAQVRMPVECGATEASLAARLLPLEHRLLPFAVELVASGRARLAGDRILLDGRPLTSPLPLDGRERP